MKYKIALAALFFVVACAKEKGNDPNNQKEDIAEGVVNIGDRIAKVSFVGTIEEKSEESLHEGVRLARFKIKTRSQTPQPLAFYILEADLKNPNIAVRAATPDDGETFKLQTVPDMAKAADKAGNHVLAAVNADFFSWTGEPWGPVVKRGKVLRDKFHDSWHGFFFAIDKNSNPIIGSGANFPNLHQDLEEAVGGEYRLINDGRRVSHENTLNPQLGILVV